MTHQLLACQNKCMGAQATQVAHFWIAMARQSVCVACPLFELSLEYIRVLADLVLQLTRFWRSAGLNTAIYSPSGANSGVGFVSITSNPDRFCSWILFICQDVLIGKLPLPFSRLACGLQQGLYLQQGFRLQAQSSFCEKLCTLRHSHAACNNAF